MCNKTRKELHDIAHIRNDNGIWKIQTITKHSAGVAELTEKFLKDFGLGELAKLMGLLHDVGKNQEAFQRYIAAESGYTPNCKSERVPHAYIGGLYAQKILGDASFIIAYPILGHHRGLYNCDDYQNIMKSCIPPECDIALPHFDLEAAIAPLRNLCKCFKRSDDIHYLIRMMFSSLVDADWLDTEAFMQPCVSTLRQRNDNIAILLERLEKHLLLIGANAPKTSVNNIRDEIQKLCAKAAEESPAIFSLTVPTGGGKTLSSMLFALRHAVKYGKKRIIIAIPYNSIIAQTASVLKGIFGAENVLEHHSNVDFSASDEDNVRNNDPLPDKLRLASENWDYPIVVTTNVQLFESLYSNKPGRCRKLHNICNSVLILDEVQTLPITFLQPIVNVLSALHTAFGVSVLMTTASMPALARNYRGTGRQEFRGLDTVHEIIPADMQLHKRLARTELKFIDTRINSNNYDSIARCISRHSKVLCIVNTRNDALEIFKRLNNDEGHCIHLSRLMCSRHIQDNISLIKQLLNTKGTGIVRVVSTQLIEAGVDIDFPIIYRQIAGLDSLIQAAGRCNREGKQKVGYTYVFHLNKELPRGFISDTANATESLVSDIITYDWFSPETIRKYFERLYSRCGEFDEPNVSGLCKSSGFYFETVSNKFTLIKDDSVQVIVPYKESSYIIENLKHNGWNNSLFRKLGQYSVGVLKNQFKELYAAGMLEELYDGIFYLSDSSQYNLQTGLNLQNNYLEEIFIK